LDEAAGKHSATGRIGPEPRDIGIDRRLAPRVRTNAKQAPTAAAMRMWNTPDMAKFPERDTDFILRQPLF
jgi:hypothetical protein